MVDRMLVDVAGDGLFRISKQGFDVKTATALQLAFSEDRDGLIPSAKGSFSGNATIALPEAGIVPIVLFSFSSQSTSNNVTAKINDAKTQLQITSDVGGRYVIFKNKQY